jgi:hypothetical protein
MKEIKLNINRKEALKLCYGLLDRGFTFPEWDEEAKRIGREGNSIQYFVEQVLKEGDFVVEHAGIQYYLSE